MKNKIRTILVMFTLTGLLTASAAAQVLSNGTGGGDWNTGATWALGVVPIGTDNVVIQGSDVVTLAAAGSCANLTMNAGTKISLATGLTLPGTSWNLNTTSTVEYLGVPSSFVYTTYGNLIYSGANYGLASNLTVNGNLTITTATLRGNIAASGTLTHTIAGNVIISGTAARISGVNSTSSTSASCTWSIGGSLSLTGNNAGNRMILFERAGPHAGTVTFNIDGDFNIGTASQLQFKSSSSTTTNFGNAAINIKGNIVQNGPIGLNSATSGTIGSFAINLIGTAAQDWSGTGAFSISPSFALLNVNVSNPAGLTLSSGFANTSNTTVTVASGGLLKTGTSVIAGTGSVVVSAGGTITSGHASGLNGNITATGATGGGNSLNTAGNYIYNGAIAQATGAMLPATVHNLTINNASGVTLSQPVTVNGVLTLAAGLFDNTGQTVTMPPGSSLVNTGGSMAQAPLPVELSSFVASAKGEKIELAWTTATEKNNSGFSIERKSINGKWNTLGFVKGHGTANAPNSYHYADVITVGGTYSYRLKQLDNDGKFEYSKEVEATVALTADQYTVSQNFPNPFNPATNIRFAVKTTQHASLKVYNLIGQEVATLFEGTVLGGAMNVVTFDASRLTSGTYIYQFKSAERTEVKRMTLMK